MPRKAANSRNQRRALFAKMIEDLQRERDELVARLEELDAELADYGVAPASGRGKARRASSAGAKRATKSTGRGVRAGSLKDYIVKVVGPTPMSPADIAAEAVKAGYQSASKTLPQSVSVACAQLVKAGHLKKEGRGQFCAA